MATKLVADLSVGTAVAERRFYVCYPIVTAHCFHLVFQVSFQDLDSFFVAKQTCFLIFLCCQANLLFNLTTVPKWIENLQHCFKQGATYGWQVSVFIHSYAGMWKQEIIFASASGSSKSQMLPSSLPASFFKVLPLEILRSHFIRYCCFLAKATRRSKVVFAFVFPREQAFDVAALAARLVYHSPHFCLTLIQGTLS